MRTRKRGGGGGDHGDAAVLDAVGLGAFAGLVLHDDPREELPLAAAYDDASGCITASLGGAAVSASPVDLAAALALQRGPVGLAAGVDAALFSSAEAIAAVRGFVRDRVLLGAGEDDGAASEEVAVAQRLVEEGKAYKVDWGGLVWAVVKGEVVAGGTPRRYSPFLVRLMEFQRPELFAEVDERLPLRKRWKGQKSQQCQWTGEKLVICAGQEVEEEETSLVYEVSHDIGDLEEMPIFGEGQQVPVPVPLNCKRAFVEGDEIHGLSEGNAELGSQNCLPSEFKLLVPDMECDDGKGFDGGNASNWSSAKQYDHLSPQQVISGTKSQPGSNQQCMIEIEDEDDDDNVSPSIPLIKDTPLDIPPFLLQQQEVLGICNHQTLSPFQACMQEILGSVPDMVNGYLDMEKACRDTRAEVERIKEMVVEKDHILAATLKDIMAELQARQAETCRLEHEKKTMCHNVQQCKMLFKKSSADFQGYRNNWFRGEPGNSYSDVHGTAGEQNRAWVQQLHHHLLQNIDRIRQTCFSNSLKLFKKISEVEMGMAGLNHEMQRLNNSRSIPDLNDGMEDDGECEASPSKEEDNAPADEGGCVSNTTLGGKQLGELIANPDQRSGTEETLDVNGVQGRCSEDEACHGSAAPQGTS